MSRGPGGGRQIVIVGHGVAGMTAAAAARAQDSACRIVLLGDEPYDAYYRPRLSHDLVTGIDPAKLRLRPETWYSQQRVEVRRGGHAESVDAAARTVTVAGQAGPVGYDALVLATGSTSFMPPLEGGNRSGVFALRSAADAQAIRQAALGVSAAAVAGGGLLGLEAAHALVQMVGRVVVLERGPWLLRRQLDQAGGEILAGALGRAGIEVWTGVEVEAALGAGEAGDAGGTKLGALKLKDGRVLAAGLLVVAAGVRPSVALAQSAGLALDRSGVVVDDRMLTSDPAVFACGDCAAHKAGNYSIWPQAMAQGRVAGGNAAGGQLVYQPIVPQNLLEVAGTSVFAVGESGALAPDGAAGVLEVVFRAPGAGQYANFRVRDGVLSGAMLVGLPDLAKRAKPAVEGALPCPGLEDVDPAERYEWLVSRIVNR